MSTNPGPNDRLHLRDVAGLAGVSYYTIKGYHQRRLCNLPLPEGYDDPSGRSWKARPWWRRSTIEGWLKARSGPGRYNRYARGPYARRTDADGLPVPRQRSGERVRCPACGKDVDVTLSGALYTHGPRRDRCPRSGHPAIDVAAAS